MLYQCIADRFWMLSVALVMASCIGIVVYKDTTSRLHGYGNAFVCEIADVDTSNELETVF